MTRALTEQARHLTIPTLLVRGMLSDMVSAAALKEFQEIVPHSEFIDVPDAAHMVAGDKNDVFCDAVLEFLERRLPPTPKPGPSSKL